MRRKKATVLAACALCAVSLAVGAASADIIETIQAQLRPDFSVVIDGKEKTFKNVDGERVYPLLYEGTTYLPVRAIGEIMGKTVYWYEGDKRIELKDEKSTVTDADVIVTGKDKENKDKTDKDDKKPQDASVKITLEEAKKIAAEKAGLKIAAVNFTKEKLERDDGIFQYELKFSSDTTKYAAEISAEDGTILSWSAWDIGKSEEEGPKGSIGIEKAKEIALKKAGFSESEVIFTEAAYEVNHGRGVYEIEFRKDQAEYNAEILASDGTVISWEIDRD